MATVLSIVTDAFAEIGVGTDGSPLTAEDSALGLRRFQLLLDGWQADRLTLSVQQRTPISWPTSTSTQTVGPTGDIAIQRPVWINELNYVVVGSSPEVEVSIGPMDSDSYAIQSIKSLQSQYPISYFYQTTIDTTLGSLFLWPQPAQDLTLYLYSPPGVDVPAALSDVIVAPPGYAEAFMYQLAIRLCGPYGRQVPDQLRIQAADAFGRMRRPNVAPGLLGVDAALAPATGGGYNIISDVTSGYSR